MPLLYTYGIRSWMIISLSASFLLLLVSEQNICSFSKVVWQTIYVVQKPHLESIIFNQAQENTAFCAEQSSSINDFLQNAPPTIYTICLLAHTAATVSCVYPRSYDDIHLETTVSTIYEIYWLLPPAYIKQEWKVTWIYQIIQIFAMFMVPDEFLHC